LFIGNSANGQLPLRSTQAATQDLADTLDRLTWPDFLQKHGAFVIEDRDRKILVGLISNIGVIGASEMGQANTYFVPVKRGWDMTAMIAEAEVLLSVDARAALTADELRDIREAGRCLAFEVPTAAAFHLHRALESVVLRYMPIFNVALKESERNLGRYVKELVAHNVAPEITTMLDHIQKKYRNPAIHPGHFLTVDAAAAQLGLVGSAIDMMITDLTARVGATAP